MTASGVFLLTLVASGVLAFATILIVVSMPSSGRLWQSLRRRSLVTGVRSPTEFGTLPSELLQHIRETDYTWKEVLPGEYLGVLDRGFKHYFSIVWDSNTSTLILREARGERFTREYQRKQVQRAGDELSAQFRQDLHNEVVNQVTMERKKAAPPKLPMAVLLLVLFAL